MKEIQVLCNVQARLTLGKTIKGVLALDIGPQVPSPPCAFLLDPGIQECLARTRIVFSVLAYKTFSTLTFFHPFMDVSQTFD